MLEERARDLLLAQSAGQGGGERLEPLGPAPRGTLALEQAYTVERRCDLPGDRLDEAALLGVGAASGASMTTSTPIGRPSRDEWHGAERP